MKNDFYYHILIIAIFLNFSSIVLNNLQAKPAKPGLIEVSQPDGTPLSIQIIGDEKHHFTISSDGYFLTTDSEGYYVYALPSDDGFIIPSTIKASNPINRTAETDGFIKSINVEKIKNIYEKNSGERIKKLSTNQNYLITDFPTKGKQKSLVIIVEFNNLGFKINDPQDFFFRMLNEEGFSDYNAFGSARDYFLYNSMGQFEPEFDVVGPVTLSNNYEYYGKNNAWGEDFRAPEMVVEACEKVDEFVDFSQYDRDEDGFIDNVYIFYAGHGEADGGGVDTIWPHAWDLMEGMPNKKVEFDGKRLNHYACSNELQYYPLLENEGIIFPDGIGSFVHEFSHIMGLPDLYSTESRSSFTPGDWDIMDVGSYNGESKVPPLFSSFERFSLGWTEPEIINGKGVYELPELGDSNKAFMVTTANPDEFFLFENRQNNGYDAHLPGKGMLVWHIDFVKDIWKENIVNGDSKHQYVDLVEADNVLSQSSRSGDSFPGTSNITSLTCETLPSFLDWSGNKLAVDIFEIKELSDGIVSFKAEECKSLGGIFSIDEECEIHVEGNRVSLNNKKGVIYDTMGRKITELKDSSTTLPSGVYIINTGNRSRKFVIK